jgi:hypothetical protein
MYNWTEKDEKELIRYEDELDRREFWSKNAGRMVGGAMTLVVVGLVALVTLVATA